MKKILILAFAAVFLCLTVCACSSEPDAEQDTTVISQTTAAPEAPALPENPGTSAEATAPKDTKPAVPEKTFVPSEDERDSNWTPNY